MREARNESVSGQQQTQVQNFDGDYAKCPGKSGSLALGCEAAMISMWGSQIHWPAASTCEAAGSLPGTSALWLQGASA